MPQAERREVALGESDAKIELLTFAVAKRLKAVPKADGGRRWTPAFREDADAYGLALLSLGSCARETDTHEHY